MSNSFLTLLTEGRDHHPGRSGRHQVLLGPQKEVAPSFGGQNVGQILRDLDRAQPGNGETFYQCPWEASSYRGRVQVIKALLRFRE